MPDSTAVDGRDDLDADWWRTAVVYQVYPRSFADSDADGIGDLGGVLSRLPYLADLGIDAIWLSPFYPSPLADGGYDVCDHRDVDSRIGTLADFDALTARAHHLGIKVVIDIVPNHTSDQHPWFRAALAAGRGSAARERYVFRDAVGPNPKDSPSDWRSHFGGSAWEQTPDGQWYCHLFAREQPDLNWDNDEVREYFLDTLRFWADRGVDGFRVDAAHCLAKDLSEPLRSQPDLDTRLPADGTDPLYDRDDVHAIYQEWRQVLNEYQPPRMGIAEAWQQSSERTYLYARPTELGQVFDFSLVRCGWDQEQFRRVVQQALASYAVAGGGLTWVLSSHDVPRHASRLALPSAADIDRWLSSDGKSPPVDSAVGLRRARAATLMMLALPGAAYLYQGEELGLPEVADLPGHVLQDPVWHRTGGALKGRDGCRVLLPWTRSGSSFGFGADGAWLPQPPYFESYSVQAQEGAPGSTLETYRAALSLRRRHPAVTGSAFSWRDAPEGILAFDRGEHFRCIVNLSQRTYPLATEGADVLLASSPLDHDDLPPDHAVWLVA